MSRAFSNVTVSVVALSVLTLLVPRPASAQTWNGWVRCVIDIQGSGTKPSGDWSYANKETHTWTMTNVTVAAAAPGTWTVAGEGSWSQSNTLQSDVGRWSINSGGAVESGARFRASVANGVVTISPQHGQLGLSGGIAAYTQQTISGSVRSPTTFSPTAYAWQVPSVQGPASSSTLSGTYTRSPVSGWGTLRETAAPMTETCSWEIGKNSMPSPPPDVDAPREVVPPGQTRVTDEVSSLASWPTAAIQLDVGDLVGGGARTNWTGNGNLLTATYPGPLGPILKNQWVAAGKDHWYPDPTTITAFAIGLADPEDHWEVTVVAETSPSMTAPVARATLPPGYALTGGGCLLNWAQGSPGHLLTASFPSSLTTWECRGKDHPIEDRPIAPRAWLYRQFLDPGRVTLNPGSVATVTSYVIGVRPKVAGLALPDVEITSSTSSLPASHPEASVPGRTDPGWTVTGGGALALPTNPNGAGQLLTASMPTVTAGSSAPTGWYAKSKDHGITSPGTVQVFAINVKFY
jgi:hypothetical protein